MSLSPISLADIAAGSGGFAIDGEAAGDRSGYSVAAAGDVNGDGFADLIIGARAADGGIGKGYVVFGSGAGCPAAISLADVAAGTGGFVITGAVAGGQAGTSVASAGDVNGDGIADLIIGAPGADQSYVVFGTTGGFAAGIDLSDIAAGTGGFVLDGAGSNGAGQSVAAAGDLNGDGIGDLIIGAPGASPAAGFAAGRSFVVFGTTGGFPASVSLSDVAAGTGGFVTDGAAAGDHAGRSVAAAGDINGDGFADLVIGAYGADPGATNGAGTSYVVFGGADGFPAGIALADVAAGTGGFVIDGQLSYDASGFSVAAAGDVNGDGIDDIIVGAIGATYGGLAAGRSYVVFGQSGGFAAAINLSDVAAGTGGFAIDGQAGDTFGVAVAGAGDINGDGIDDLIIGTQNGAEVGRSYVVFGTAGGFGAGIDLADLAGGTGGFVIDGQAVGDYAGLSVAAAGDVNGDGFGDLLVGATGASPAAGSAAGESYVIFGGDFTGGVTQHAGVAGELLVGGVGADDIVGNQGDDTLAGNGGADVLLGGAGNDVVDVFDLGFQRVDGGSGSNTLVLDGGDDTLDLGTSAGSRLRNVARIDLGSGNNGLTLTAHAVANLSPIGNTLRVDGTAGDSVQLGADGWRQGASVGGARSFTSGAVTVLVDEAVAVSIVQQPIALADVAAGSGGFVLDGQTFDESGFAVASAGDVNGDGFADLVIGAFLASPAAGSNAGRSYVVFGQPTGFPASIDLADVAAGTGGFVLTGEAAGDISGYSVAAAGDVNGDGFADIIIGAQHADPAGGGNAGKAYVVLGTSGGFPASISLADVATGTGGFAINGEAAGDNAGFAVASAGDVNGDGIGDFIISAAHANRAYVVFGRPDGFTAGVNLSDVTAGTGGFELLPGVGEIDVASAGDLNGDGFDDLVISAPRSSVPGRSYAGESFVLFGHAGLFPTGISLPDFVTGTNGFLIKGESAGDGAGYSVASAGDVNGDGFADLLIGAPYAATTAGGRAGKSYVVLGRAGGFSGTIDLADVAAGSGGFVITGDIGGGEAGRAVASAGDVNGDGFDDVLIGSRYSGRSYLVFGHAGAFPAGVDLADIASGTGGFVIVGAAADQAGRAVASAGDLNGDGFDDLVIGAPNAASVAGQSFVIYGRNFSGAVTQQGTAGPNLLVGGAAADDIVGGPANDTLTGAGGADVLLGGAGDDVIHVGDVDFRRVDGGSGSNALVLDGAGLTLDLPGLSASALRNIASIDLSGSGDNRLDLTALRVLDLSGSSNTLLVGGDAGDSVSFGAESWARAVAAGGFVRFTNGLATVDVASAVSVTAAAFTAAAIDLGDVAGGTGGFVINGEDAGDQAGASVASAGDVNGDGFADVIIGAREAAGAGNGVPYAGDSYVVFGAAGGIPASLSLTDVSAGIGGFVIHGAYSGDLSGSSVASAGDINGDGIDDLIIGAPDAGPGGHVGAGDSYVVFGSAGGFGAGISLANVGAGIGGFAIHGANADDYAGASVASAGDINGDGFADLIIGAAEAASGAGASYVVFGSASGFAGGVNLGDVAGGTGGFVINGEAGGDGSGYSVASAGDINGDGLADLVIGAPHAAANAGSSYVVFGTAGGFAGGIDLADIAAGTGGFVIHGQYDGDGSGFSVASAGDVNGDGFSDVVIGAPEGPPGGSAYYSGESFVVFGGAGGFAGGIDLAAIAAGSGGFIIRGEESYDAAGRSVASAGDINGDGIDDIIIGAPRADAVGNARSNAGESYVVFGRAGGFPAAVDLADVAGGTGGFVIDGQNGGDQSGNAVAAAGDVNGDGYGDLIVGAPGLGAVGKAYVVFGGDFTGSVTQPGSAGADLLTGDAGADDFVGGQGDDTLVGNGGADVLLGGAGDDVIHVSDFGFQRVDGGSGSNALALDGAGMTLDLGAIAASRLLDIGRIDLTGSGDNQLDLTALRVLDLSGSSNLLTVDGDAGDRVLLGSEAWIAGAAAGGFVPYTDGQATLEVASAVGVACFAAGSRILTTRGEVAVEALAVGDGVPVLVRGGVRRVRWIGHRTLCVSRHPRPRDVQPVRVVADAFGPGLPHGDLRLSPDHAVHVRPDPGGPGVLVPIRHLINGVTIASEAVETVTYYHVELADETGAATHEVLLAQGLPAESFLDTGNRGVFANGGQPLDLHPDFALAVWDAAACAELVQGGAALDTVRAAVRAQATRLGWTTTDDPGLCLRVDGVVVEPEWHGGEFRFRLHDGAKDVRILSRTMVPAQLCPDSQDTRRLGVAVSQIALDGQVIALDDARLAGGWHTAETSWRWTDGEACLRCAGGMVEMTILPLGRYWLAEAGRPEGDAPGVPSLVRPVRPAAGV